ncbi:hypothetical protein H4582DRAFT_2066770 [Lactarius indigo]|nr:hypothetical protein H4582DRAFT_2066770 [Lactarius indigo]
MSSKNKAQTRFPTPEEGLAIRTLHEATLQELISARNYPLLQIIHERNELMRERNTILGTDVEFPEYDYINPPSDDSTLPYMALWINNECRVLPFRRVRPSWAQYPVDHIIQRRRFDASTQTENADTTPVEVDASELTSCSEEQVLDEPIKYANAIQSCQFNPNTRTNDADVTMVENELSDSKSHSVAQVVLDDDKEFCGARREEHTDKKRKISE